MGDLERKVPHRPYQLRTSQQRSHVVAVVKKAIRDGLDVEEGFLLAGIPNDTYQRWKREAIEDWNDGFTGTGLQDVLLAVAEEDIALHKRLRQAMFKKAEEGDTRMMMYLEDNRFGASNKRKQKVEVGSKGGNNIQINITPMTSVESDEEKDDAIDVSGEVQDYDELE